MSAWSVVACLLTLRSEFNAVSPNRDKGADGTIGDAAHSPSSDHSPDEDSPVLRDKDADSVNEVHALDIDSSGSWPDGRPGDETGSWFDLQIHRIIAAEKRRWLDPSDMCRLRYVIWKKRIYSTSNNFEGEAYTGDDPHTNHAHFSSRYESRAENDTRPWGVAASLEADMDEASIIKAFRNAPDNLSDTERGKLAAAVDAKITARFNTLAALITGLGVTDVDEDQIAASVLAGFTADKLAAGFVAAGFTPQAMADLIPAEMAEQVVDILAARLDRPATS